MESLHNWKRRMIKRTDQMNNKKGSVTIFVMMFMVSLIMLFMVMIKAAEDLGSIASTIRIVATNTYNAEKTAYELAQNRSY